MIYMKKILLALLAVGSLATANAQKGSWLHYGNVGIFTDKTDMGSAVGTNKTLGWNINPGIGYQFSKYFTVGVQGGYSSLKNKVEVPWPTGEDVTLFKERTQNWQAGAFLRHTYAFNNTFSVYHQLDVSAIGGSWMRDTITGSLVGSPLYGRAEATYTGFAVSITPAVSINVHDGFALNFSVGGIGYSTRTWDIKGVKQDIKESSFAFTWGQQFNIGISKNMCMKHKHHGHMEPGMEHRKMKKHHADEDDE
jgi:hypothetical protein